ncbi:MAG: aminopeptidase P family protein [Telmatospirillum sp.]|nr:aminopeptidase P family protein [Telmatospirillum sp.]
MASPTEIDRRQLLLRAAMREAGFEALVIVGNTEFQQKGYIRYYANWRLYGGTAFLVVPLVRDPTLVLGLGAQAEWAKELSAIADTRAVPDKIEAVAALLRETVGAKAPVGIVGMKTILAHGDAQRLAVSLPDHPLVDATDLVEELWCRLSPEDLTAVARAHDDVACVFEAFKAALRPGRCEREVVADAFQTAIGRGALEGVIHLNHDFKAGTRPASDRRIESGDVYKMFMEFLTDDGYLVELGACFSFRPPGAAWLRKHALVVAAIENAIAATRPGMVADDVVGVIRRTYEKSGVEIVGRRLWDFHGQGMHSLLRPFGLPGSTDPIRENTMINIHPGILTADGLGISATNNYLVTADGGRALGGFRHQWHVVG